MIYHYEKAQDMRFRLMFLETMEILLRVGMVEEAKKYGVASKKIRDKWA